MTEHHEHHHVNVIVQYVGHDDFHEKVSPETTLHTIKLEAMRAFCLELSSEDKYVLQYNGVDENDEHREIGSFESETDTDTFTLVLAEEVPKG